MRTEDAQPQEGCSFDSRLSSLFKATFDRKALLQHARETGAVQRLRDIHPADLVQALVCSASGDEYRSIATARRVYGQLTRQAPEESSFYERFNAGFARLMDDLVRTGLQACNRKARRAVQSMLRGTGLIDVQAIDATQVLLPASAAEQFPSTSDAHGGVKMTAVLSVLYQTVDKVSYIDARTHDRKALRLDRWLHGRLLLLDRGYYDHGLFAKIEGRQGHFLCPLKTNAVPTIRVIRCGLGQAHVGAILNDDLPLRGVVDVDVDLKLAAGACYRCRAIRMPVVKDLRDGTFEFVDIWLVTNLPPEKFGPEQLASMYRLRWEVELAFRTMKQVGRLDHLRTANAYVIRAFMSATLLAVILAQRICAMMREQRPRSEPSVFRVASIVLTAMRDIASAIGTSTLKNVIAALIQALWREGVNPNPGRPYMGPRYAQDVLNAKR